MKTTLEASAFEALTAEELMISDGEGTLTMVLSMWGLMFTPLVCCVNPPAGVALGLVCGGCFYDNYYN